ncbi:uncharacterized protein LOC133198660 isoform X2 [Saccostrea echinata]|uniref:uncharacterized protein LOC133198660 isoform X2 n=1 Tax=Saccostrea echinata TaxID=191078 RepID=UPI002A80C201|nr:uncharacterized protein LOC133198660 isoform X2 [Saccostrea echinata]
MAHAYQLSSGASVLKGMQAKISTDSRSSLGGFTSGFLSGMSAMLFLFVTVCGSMYLARKYEEHKELKRMRKRQEVLQIQENGHN